MGQPTIAVLTAVLSLYAQDTTRSVGPTTGAKRATAPVAKAAAESPEHALARKQFEQMRARFESLSGDLSVYSRLTLALEPSTLCSFDKPDNWVRWWRDCHFNMASASQTAGMSEDSLKQAMKLLCSDIQFYEPPSACYDKVQALSADVSKQLEAIDLLAMRVRLERVDPCLRVYRSTIDKKVSDYTTREMDLVNGCRSLDLYPPEK
jgi:hypothetical protein